MRPIDLTTEAPKGYTDAIEELEQKTIRYKDTGSKAPKGKRSKQQISSLTVDDAKTRLSELIEDWLDEEGKFHSGAPVWEDKTKTKAFRNIRKKISNQTVGWGNARADLIALLGQYCSYCGIPMRSVLHIEHVLPKSMFPEKMFEWSNFLLACPSCNSTKSNRPNQVLNLEELGRLSTEDAEALIADREPGTSLWLWPHMQWAQLRLRAPLPFRLQFVRLDFRGGRLEPVDDVVLDQMDLHQAYDRWRRGVLKIDRNVYYLPPPEDAQRYAKNRYFALISLPNPVSELKSAAKETADLVGFNKIVKQRESSHTVDRRLQLRTEAYFVAWRTLELYHETLELGDSDLTAAVWRRLTEVIKNTGFWDVWLWVMTHPPYRLRAPQTILRDLFPGTSAFVWQGE